MYMVPIAANAFHTDCVPITDALRCLKDYYYYNLFIQERSPVIDLKYDVVMDLPDAVIPFSNLLGSHEDNVQDVPVASYGELQIKHALLSRSLCIRPGQARWRVGRP